MSLNSNRRQFFAGIAVWVATFWVGSKSSFLFAAEKPKSDDLPPGKTAVSETDSVASSLGYRHSGAQVDKKKYPNFKADQSCANCTLYTAENKQWGKCPLFPNGLANAKGWCASWSKKA